MHIYTYEYILTCLYRDDGRYYILIIYKYLFSDYTPLFTSKFLYTYTNTYVNIYTYR